MKKNKGAAVITGIAEKIFKMKTSQKIALGTAATLAAAATGVVVAKSVQAKKTGKKRSEPCPGGRGKSAPRNRKRKKLRRMS